ncbi:MAG: tRNA (guanosine(37)-N1)-methyltransferase TrmD [Candidatus Liptonbacteria bacterium]|nr:tRNA (guanosine(37)-N1)-methyltransferase TrmD [Candidatus Liptonbacteria bacterium]
MRFHVITIFPKILDSYFAESLFNRARKNKILEIHVHNLRDYTADKHHKVDDRPFGGGPGMVFKIEPIFKAVNKLLSSKLVSSDRKLKNLKTYKLKTRVILFSTRGKKFDQKTAKRLSKYDELILICGRYEGVDERVAKYVADEEISIGDYVLSGGELPAAILIEAVSRYIPGFLGKLASLEDIKGSYPVYTRPSKFFYEKFRRSSSLKNKKQKSWDVPKVLLRGHHKYIKEWRGHGR